MLTYAEWNQALADRFFPPGLAGAPVYLAVSEDVLRDTAGANAVDEFTHVVRERYLSAYDGLLGRRLREDLRWRHGPGPVPPYLGLLGLCVLAASEMATDAGRGIWSSNYYARLNPLLGLKADGGAPHGFDELSGLWRDLDAWLAECGGDRGGSTVSTHPTLVHVGYPMSQAIFPVRDRRRLPDFFVSAGLEPGQEVSAGELLRHLRRWAHPGCGLRELTIDRIADPGWEEMVSAVVLAEFRNWDGALRDPSGRRRAEVTLNVFVSAGGSRCEVYYVPKQPEGFPDEVVAGGLPLVSDGGGWYQALPEHLVPGAFESGIVLVSDDGLRSFSFEPRPIIPLHQSFNAGLGGWLSVRRIHLHEPLRVVLREERLPALQAYLRRGGEAGHARPAAGLPRGWLLLSDAVVTSALAGPAGGDPDLERILPRLSTSMSFDGGLALEPRCYLRGEEPIVHLGLEEPANLLLDGESQSLAAGGISLPLSDLGLLAGHHSLRLGETSRSFLVSVGDAGPAPAGAGHLSFILERHGPKARLKALDALAVGEAPGPGQIWVSGASVRGNAADAPLDMSRTLLLRRDHEIVVVGYGPGELMESAETPRPRWLDRIGPGAGAQFYEASCPFPAAFALYHSGTEWRAEALDVRESNGSDPRPTELRGAHGEAELRWAQLLSGAAGAVVLPRSATDRWERLVEAASALLAEAA
ncbi:MAG: hypothetical protein AB7O78_02635 [Thermoleophilia bacterium]